MKFLRCEMCKELDPRPEYGRGTCKCAYQKDKERFPIVEGFRTEDYLSCHGQGYRDE